MLVVAIGLQVVAPNDIFTPTSVVRMRGGSEAVSSEAGSSSNRLRTISGKKVIMRRKGDGSRAYMYLNGRINVTVLQNAMGIPAPACLVGITPKDYRIHVVLQEPMLEPLVRRNA
ncbi:hypothetical protein Tco_0829952 [Tanacetum coccineum]